MLRSQFEVMKERNHLKYVLEWATPGSGLNNNGGPSISPRSDPSKVLARDATLHKSGQLREGGNTQIIGSKSV